MYSSLISDLNHALKVVIAILTSIGFQHQSGDVQKGYVTVKHSIYNYHILKVTSPLGPVHCQKTSPVALKAP